MDGWFVVLIMLMYVHVFIFVSGFDAIAAHTSSYPGYFGSISFHRKWTRGSHLDGTTWQSSFGPVSLHRLQNHLEQSAWVKPEILENWDMCFERHKPRHHFVFSLSEWILSSNQPAESKFSSPPPAVLSLTAFPLEVTMTFVNWTRTPKLFSPQNS